MPPYPTQVNYSNSALDPGWTRGLDTAKNCIDKVAKYMMSNTSADWKHLTNQAKITEGAMC